MSDRAATDQTADAAQHFCSSLDESVVPGNISKVLTNFITLEQADSRQSPVSGSRNLFGQDQVCGNNFKGFGGVTSLVKLAETRWGSSEVARHHLFLVRMCLKALSCFQASSVSNALRDYFWSLDAVKNHDEEPACAGLQSTKETRSSIVKPRHCGAGHYRKGFFKIFVFTPHGTVELCWSSSHPVLAACLHWTWNSSSCSANFLSSNSASCFSCQWNKNGKQQWMKSHCLILNYRGHYTLLSCLSVLWACVSTPVQGNAIGKGDAIRSWFIKCGKHSLKYVSSPRTELPFKTGNCRSYTFRVQFK